MATHVKYLAGYMADPERQKDVGEATFAILDGPHADHVVFARTEKHGCGAWTEKWTCSCMKKFWLWTSGCSRHVEYTPPDGDGDLEIREIADVGWRAYYLQTTFE